MALITLIKGFQISTRTVGIISGGRGGGVGGVCTGIVVSKKIENNMDDR